MAFALGRAAEIIDNDTGTARAEEQSVDLAEAATSSGDDNDLAVVPQLLGHGVLNGVGKGAGDDRMVMICPEREVGREKENEE